MRRFLLACLLLAATTAQAAVQDTWMSVTLEGRKIGHLHNRREATPDRVTTTQEMSMSIERAGISIALEVSETHEETAAGEPLGFRTRSRMSGVESTSVGRVAGGRIEVTSSVGGISQNKTLAWPAGALFSEGLRLDALRHGLKPGTRYESLAFQALNLDAFPLSTTILPPERVYLPEGRRELVRVEHELALPGLPLKSTDWIDKDLNVKKVVMSQLGLKLEVLACDEACARAPNQSGDSLSQALLQAPRSLERESFAAPLRYRLSPRDRSRALQIPATDEQTVQREGDSVLLTVIPEARSNGTEKPAPADTQPNDWLQSGASEIVRLANEASPGEGKSDAERMRELEKFVFGYIDKKSLNVGYASALETARTRQGDCTEHALLLAALGRARGIPTRVATGLAYIEQFGGAERVFVPHAWAQAWIDGRWQSYDAALGRFDSSHITLGVGDGDPWRFYAGVGTLGNLTLEKVEAARAN
ncbi:transglutaminase-like domain-containing protein [Tahibacter harae]|uniref:Transglutaminase-like domain-containing protein n=1 Tax=Tahibacter harae TaxID=2963937 RepID=A0ABT1QSR8_9GAMM|nr:transglutaminase-like domain-containing protein [Tahibacter harae]MCQ4165317.1 transglutaminase-like domain-containing protein [Tahibacter harae]